MKSRFTEEQIIKALTRVKNGMKPRDVGRELGVSEHTIFNWKKKYQNMTVSEAKRLRELESENTRLKKASGRSQPRQCHVEGREQPKVVGTKAKRSAALHLIEHHEVSESVRLRKF